MIIDLHSHEMRYSPDSFQTLDEMTLRAKELGIDAICITDHDSQGLASEIGWESTHNGIRIFVGCEYYTAQGDILVFGAKALPTGRIDIRQLWRAVKEQGGVMIAAHPYRHNLRGIMNGIYDYADCLVAVEGYNGSTFARDNARAVKAAKEAGLHVVGAADSHNTTAMGSFATEFAGEIHTVEALVQALKEGNYWPVEWMDGKMQPIPMEHAVEKVMA